MDLLKYIIIFNIVFYLNGCKLLDDMFNYHLTEENNQVEKYSKIKFQTENAPRKLLIPSSCKYNKKIDFIYYETPNDVEKKYYKDTKSLISKSYKKIFYPFWDIRYTNNIEKYIDENTTLDDYADLSLATGLDIKRGIKNFVAGTDKAQVDPFGSAVETECINNSLVSGATINLKDAPEQFIKYAGPQATFTYILSDKNNTSPWKNKSGNLMLQTYFNDPIYINFSRNIGASISYGVILKNNKNNKYINYIIGIYTAGEGWKKEQSKIKYDPTTKMIHVATIAREKSKFSTISPRSQSITILHSNPNAIAKKERDSFFRVNISYSNLKNVLKELKNNPPLEANNYDFGLNPEDWQVSSVFIQYEVEEEGGDALLSASFKKFEVYISKLPI